ncbi:unnamed protein product [Rotaria sp. Silwood1]|nr:unnamed protein product [Rotaria sp. Silwood1]CAF1625454.1 unnamed protein product [Rotaria sp. Silwood1]CAF3731431.1 unnamed protein product [Rotaria sp. Silwood1]CAF3770001.1 unnamed protein product [Rotaria sp. Silwood1]CAF4671255.1 unnamed protein product [Rotaria sp. Silwood1]
MASAASNNSARGRLIHVGFMVPLNELMFENEALERELSHLNFRFNIYSAVLFYKTSNQDALHAWFEQRKRSARTGYLRGFYSNKKSETIIEMDVDGKQFYLIASSATSKPPVEMKKDISRGLFGERKSFAERIPVTCFPYKYDADAGFIECEAFTTFKKEQKQKQDALQLKQDEKPIVLQ